MCQRRIYKNTNTQIHKHTNRQIQHMTKCQKNPTCGISLKRGLFKDIKNDIPVCQTCKYKNTNTKYTNTQIQHMTKCQKDPPCGIFLKRWLFKDQKWYSPMSKAQIPKYKYTNTQTHKYSIWRSARKTQQRRFWQCRWSSICRALIDQRRPDRKPFFTWWSQLPLEISAFNDNNKDVQPYTGK